MAFFELGEPAPLRRHRAVVQLVVLRFDPPHALATPLEAAHDGAVRARLLHVEPQLVLRDGLAALWALHLIEPRVAALDHPLALLHREALLRLVLLLVHGAVARAAADVWAAHDAQRALALHVLGERLG